eukprot:4736897-Prymnesium_polylepis.1
MTGASARGTEARRAPRAGRERCLQRSIGNWEHSVSRGRSATAAHRRHQKWPAAPPLPPRALAPR